MAYIPWWQRMSPPTFAERFDLGGLAGRVKFNTGQLVKPSTTGIRPGYGGTGSGGHNVGLGTKSIYYKPLDAKGEKIAKHVYGTLDISDQQRLGIVNGEITMNTKPVKWKAGDISVKNIVRGGHEVKEVVFKNKTMEKDFIKYLKLRAQQPMKAVYEYGNEWFSKNFPISKRQVDRAIPYLMKKHNINYIDAPKTSSGYSTKVTRQTLKKTSSVLEEGRIGTAKTKILKDLNLKKKIDFAHRVSKSHMEKLGLQFSSDLVGMDSRIINQVIVRPAENTLNKLYKDQLKIFEELKNNPTDELRTKLTNLNKEIKKVINTTSGRLVGVTIDPHTLEASFEGVKKKYSLTKFIGENMTLKELEKLSPADQQKFLTKQLTNAVNAEVKKGFVPNDFKKILTDSKSREAILKYAKKLGPAVIKQLQWAFKNPNSKVAMKVLSKLSLTEGFIIEDVLKKFAEGKTSMEAMASPLLLDKPVHQLLKRSKADDQQNWAYDRVNFLKYIKDGAATGSQLAQMANKDPDFDGKYTDYIEFLKAMAADPHQQKLIRERDIETEAELTLPAEKVAERSERYETWNKMPAVRAVKDYFKSDEQKEKERAHQLENLLNV